MIPDDELSRIIANLNDIIVLADGSANDIEIFCSIKAIEIDARRMKLRIEELEARNKQ